MTRKLARLTATALLGATLTSCSLMDKGKERQALLDHHLKIIALDEAAAQDTPRIASSAPSPSTDSRTEIIMPLGDPQPLVDEVQLAPEGPSRPFAADPVDEVGLFPEE